MIATLALALAGLPLLMTLVNLFVYRTPAGAGGRPAISVLIPARDEAAHIGAACAAALASEDVDLELLVLDDQSTDATAAILAGIADPRLRVLAGRTLPPGWSGKTHACHCLAAAARSDLLLFIDADVRLAPDAASRIAGFMQRSRLALASGVPRQITVTWAERLLLPLIHFLLLGFLPMPLMRLSRAPALGAGCGQLMAVRRDAYRRAGGHAAVRATLHDGLCLPRAFRQAGEPTGLFDASRLATCRMYGSAREVWQGLGKNASEGMAKPLALPVWTALLGVGQVLPWALLPARSAIAAIACALALRLLLAWRFRQPLDSALLHPVGIIALLVLQWNALARRLAGRPAVWRGRAYEAS